MSNTWSWLLDLIPGGSPESQPDEVRTAYRQARFTVDGKHQDPGPAEVKEIAKVLAAAAKDRRESAE